MRNRNTREQFKSTLLVSEEVKAKYKDCTPDKQSLPDHKCANYYKIIKYCVSRGRTIETSDLSTATTTKATAKPPTKTTSAAIQTKN